MNYINSAMTDIGSVFSSTPAYDDTTTQVAGAMGVDPSAVTSGDISDWNGMNAANASYASGGGHPSVGATYGGDTGAYLGQFNGYDSSAMTKDKSWIEQGLKGALSGMMHLKSPVSRGSGVSAPAASTPVTVSNAPFQDVMSIVNSSSPLAGLNKYSNLFG